MAGKPTYEELEQRIEELEKEVLKQAQTDRAFRESEERFRLAFENANDGVCLVDTDGNLVRVNNRMCDIFGYSKKELESMTVNDIAHPEDKNISPKFIEKSISGEVKSTVFEKRYLHKQGHIIWGQVSSSIIKDAKGDPLYFISHVQDITQRKQTEEALRDSRNMLQTVLDSIPSAVFWKDRDSIYLGGNRTWLEAAGLNASEEVAGKSDYDLPWDKEEANSFRENDRRVMESGVPEYDIIEPYLRADGINAWAKTNKVPLRDMEGNITGILGTYEDITERKQVEDALKESEEKYRLLVNNLPGIVYKGYRDWSVEFYDKSIEGLTGYNMHQFNSGRKKWIDLIVKEDVESARQTFIKALKTDKSYMRDYRLETKAGNIIWIQERGHIVCNEDGDIEYVSGVFYDITDKKKTEDQLKLSESRFRSLFENMINGAAVYEASENGKDFILVDFNKAGEKTDGITKEELIGKSVLKVFPCIRDFGLFDVFRRVYKTGMPEKYPMGIYKDERISGWRDNYVYKLPSGEIVAVYSDETERKRAEEALRESEEKFRTIFDSANDAIFIHDFDGQTLDVNQVACDRLGFSYNEFLQMRPGDFNSPEQAPLIRNRLKKLQQTGYLRFETTHIDRNGNPIPVEVISQTTSYKGEQAIISTARDITERKRSDETLRESEAKYRFLFENMLNGFAYCKIIVDENNHPIDFVYLEVNYSFEKLTGLRKEDVIGKKVAEAITTIKDTHPELLDIYGKVALTGESAKFEIYFEPLGMWLYISAYSPQKGYFVAIFENITNRKLARESLQKSEERYRSLVESTDDSIYLVAEDLTYLFMNQSHLSRYGGEAGEVIGRNYAEFHSENETNDFKNRVQAVFDTGESLSYEYQSERNGGYYLRSLNPVKGPDGKINALTVNSRDITERNRSERSLAESEKKFRNLFNNAEVGMFRTMIDGSEILDMNEKFLDIFGCTREEMQGSPSVIHWADPSEREEMARRIELEGRVTNFECRMLNKQGEVRTCLTSLFLFREQGILEGSIVDITDRMMAEAAVQDSEERYRAIFEQAADAIVLIDPKTGEFMNFNDAACDNLGYSREEFEKLKISDIDVSETEKQTITLAGKAVKKGQDTFEKRMRAKNGEMFDYVVSAKFIGYGGINILQTIWYDITGRKKSEDALEKSKKQLQHLSSQLIHAQEKERKRIALELHDEMGQSLTAIGLTLAQIEEALPPDIDPEIRNRLADIQSISLKASEQVSELSLALRPSLLDDIGLIPTLRWHLNKTGRRAKLEIKLETIDMDERLGPEIETVLFRISQEAVNNIIKHADAKHVTVRMEQKQASITLSIKDDGKGFDVHETLTDYQKGRIGLLGMQERASMVGGSLSIQSRKGHGTQILAEIPVGIGDCLD